jgi:xanthine/uracil/vitamin C permease (AzgA family)
MVLQNLSILDSSFRLSERGTRPLRELRGGVATFFALASIVVLNPLILGSGKGMYGHTPSTTHLTSADRGLIRPRLPHHLFVASFALGPIEERLGVR